MALMVHESIKDHLSDQQEWLPNVSTLKGHRTEVSEAVNTFHHHPFSGSASPLAHRIALLKNSVVQGLVFAIMRGRLKPAKHILLSLNT